MQTEHRLPRLVAPAARALRLCTWIAAAAIALAQPLAARAQDILVGQVGPFSGLGTPEATEIRDGARAYFDQVNRAGGIHGRKLSLFTLDDGLDPAVFMDRFHEALARQPVALLTLIGSRDITRLLQSGALDTSDIVILGTVPGAETFRQPGNLRLFHIRAGDKSQLDRILLHCKTLGVSRVHLIYQDIPAGTDALAAVTASARQMGGLAITSSRAANTGEALLAAARQPQAQAAESVIVIGIPQFMADAVAQLRRAGVTQSIFALSYLDVRLATQAAGLAGARGLGITQTFPNPNGQNLPVQREFRQAMERSLPDVHDYSSFHFEGYVTARVLVAGLRRIDGAPTPTSLAKALHEAGEIDLGGFSVNFGKGNVGGGWTDIGVMSANGKLLY